jgi:hypothetical protein
MVDRFRRHAVELGVQQATVGQLDRAARHLLDHEIEREVVGDVEQEVVARALATPEVQAGVAGFVRQDSRRLLDRQGQEEVGVEDDRAVRGDTCGRNAFVGFGHAGAHLEAEVAEELDAGNHASQRLADEVADLLLERLAVALAHDLFGRGVRDGHRDLLKRLHVHVSVLPFPRSRRRVLPTGS